MRSLSRVSIALILGIALTLIGCGGGSGSTPNPNPNNLTQAQAQQLGNEAYVDLGTALSDALGGSPFATARALTALRKNNQAVSASAQTVCSGISCTVSYTYDCPDGGSIVVSGSFTANGSTSASGTITETPTNCSDGTLVINGDPDVMIGAQGNNNGTTTMVNITLDGGLSFSPVQTGQFPTGSCTSNLSASVSVNDNTGAVTCSVSGSICGQAINQSCPSGAVL